MTTPGPLETKQKVIRIWLLALLWTGVVLWAGGGDLSANVTSRFIGPFLRWLLSDAPAARAPT